MRSFSGFVLCCLVGLAIAACDNNSTPTTPTPTDPVTFTDTFTGILTRNGATSHSFTVAKTGTVTATLTSLSNADIEVGFGVGTWNGTVCNVVLARDRAVQTTVIYGNVNASGELCVRIYDVGNVTDPVDYSVSVVHP